MTNPAQAIRALITYAVCIPLAMLVGWMLCNPLDYGTLGFFGLIAMLLVSPMLIRWHYPLMVFGLGSPIFCFFLQGNPPLSQVAVILCLSIAIIDRTMNSNKRFMSVPVMTWPLLFTAAMVYFTAEMTGGIGLKALGGDVAGGKKYIAIFIGIAAFFALVCRPIPREHRNWYVALFFLPGILQFISDLFPVLPSPLNYVNLLIPPSEGGSDGATNGRLGGISASASVLANFIIVKYGLRGIFRADRPMRFVLFFALLVLSLIGGFRIVLLFYIQTLFVLFFMEGLHRTRILPVALLGLALGGAVIIPLAQHLPFSYQRSLSFLPLVKFDPLVLVDADGSKKWREDMWADTWPKVPDYLLLGKGYALSKEDFLMMGDGVFANGVQTTMDRSMTALAISGDYHNGPLSTLMPFGIWGAISFLWLSGAVFFVLYRNYQFGDAELVTVNRYLLVVFGLGFVGFFFIFGAYTNAVNDFVRFAGFSVALNQGVCAPKAKPVVVQRIKPLPRPLPVIA